jgi:hypothetical protein
VLNNIKEDKEYVSDLSLSILNGILELIEGNIESKYNLDYELEFFNGGTFKAYIEASDKKESVYYEVEFNDYLSSFSVVEKDKALEYAATYCESDYAACSFLGFLEGITYLRNI